MERFLKQQITQDLEEKMVFMAGPRQVGKTTLSKSLFKKTDYLNWDIDQDRSRILAKEFNAADLWIFDEIHKFTRWRNYLKGLYDKKGVDQKILVTGSAKLDILRKGGDSLQGRYHFLRLMPLTFKELKMKNQNDLNTLYHLSGFPEPFFRGSKEKANRWSRFYRERLVREEVASNEQFLDLGTIEIIIHRLPEFVGGLFSLNSLAEDIQVAHKTLSKWMSSLERLYAIFSISPFGAPKIKAIKKAQKIYFYDWNSIIDEGGRFENFLAVHLLKWIFFEQDTKGRNLELRYYRDKYQREVDFVVCENNQPIIFIEAKLNMTKSTQGLKFLKSRFPKARALQVYFTAKKEFSDANAIEHISVIKLLNELV